MKLSRISFERPHLGPSRGPSTTMTSPHHCIVYLAAAASQSWHPCQRPPSASSPAPWSVSPPRLLQPPSSNSSRLETPPLHTLVATKRKLGVGLTVALPLFHRWRQVRGRWMSCLQRTLDSGGAFSCLTGGFWASSAHLTDQSQWAARTGMFRKEMQE